MITGRCERYYGNVYPSVFWPRDRVVLRSGCSKSFVVAEQRGGTEAVGSEGRNEVLCWTKWSLPLAVVTSCACGLSPSQGKPLWTFISSHPCSWCDRGRERDGLTGRCLPLTTASPSFFIRTIRGIGRGLLEPGGKLPCGMLELVVSSCSGWDAACGVLCCVWRFHPVGWKSLARLVGRITEPLQDSLSHKRCFFWRLTSVIYLWRISVYNGVPPYFGCPPAFLCTRKFGIR